MSRSRRTPDAIDQRQLAGMAGGALLILVALLYWGEGSQPGTAIWPNVALWGGLLLGCGGLSWWLLLSPLPGEQQVEARPRPAVRQALAYGVAASGVLFLIGGLWDAAWQQLYGNSAALDGFWGRPHLLLYGSIGLNAALAAGALAVTMRGPGGLRARVRSDRLVSFLSLASLFMLVGALSDLAWQRSNALDSAAWSLPHVMMGAGFLIVMLVAVAVQGSVLPRPATWEVRRLDMGDLNAVVLLAVAAAIPLLLGVGGWEASAGMAAGTVSSRPAWLYPALIVGVVLFIGQIALQVLRRPGAAILVFAAVLFFQAITNFLFQQLFGAVDVGAAAQFLALIPAAALDVVYVYRLPEADDASTAWIALGAGIVAMLAGGLLLLPRLVADPPVDGATLPGMIVAGIGVGIFCGWCGARIGRAMAGVRRLPPAAEATQMRLAALGASAYIVLLVAAFLFMKSTPLPP